MENTYIIRIITSNIRSAGTDANVFIDLIGRNGNSGFSELYFQETNFIPTIIHNIKIF